MTERDGLAVIAHWWCPECGAFDGPITDDDCDHCGWSADPGDWQKVERLVPEANLRGAVRLLDEFDRYASHDDGGAYPGSPFAAEVRAFLNSQRPGGRSA